MELRKLTVAQHARLDAIERSDPGAKVVGWSDESPIVRRRGRLVRLRPTGRLTPIRSAT